MDKYEESRSSNRDSGDAIFDSFWICQKMDSEEAAQKGTPLKLDTLVEDHFTHQMSVELHLDLITLATGEGEKWGTGLTDTLWRELMRAIPEVKPIILSWFADNRNIIGRNASCDLAEKLRSCDDEWLKALPDYENALDVFPDNLRFT